jgi:DNA polymerase-1
MMRTSAVNKLLDRFGEIWMLDTEFVPCMGNPVIPVCLSATEYRSGKTVELFLTHAGQQAINPLCFGPDSLIVSYSGTAEMSFFLSMGWSLPQNFLDLWVERRNLTNGLVDGRGEPIDTSLIATCTDYGIHATATEHKEVMIDRILRGYPFSQEEMRNIQHYCTDDTLMLGRLAQEIVPQIENLDEALHRGRTIKAVACMEFNGVPVSVDLFSRLNHNLSGIRAGVVRKVEDEYQFGVYIFDKHGDPHFSNKNFTALVERLGLVDVWPEWTSLGAGADDQEVLEPIAQRYPETHLEEFRQLKKFLTQAKSKLRFPVGRDGRNRSQLRPFSASSSRSQPPTAENIPNATKALRSLLAPHEGEVLMHRDWSNAEFGITAALSGDLRKWDIYLHKDVYLVKAADFGFCGYDAIKETHRELRNKFKPVVLAGQYGQTPSGLAKVLGIPEREAKNFMEKERKLYPQYQAWLRDNHEETTFNRRVETVFGWNRHIVRGTNPRTILNHPAQGNCAEIMRYAACLATERGIDLGASMHDAFFYTSPADCWQEVDSTMKACMDEASQAVLGDGYVLKSDRDTVHAPHQYSHEDGKKMWAKIEAAMVELEATAVPPSREACG